MAKSVPDGETRELLTTLLMPHWDKYQSDYSKFITLAERTAKRFCGDNEIQQTMEWIQSEFYDKTVVSAPDWGEEEDVDAVFKEPKEGLPLTTRGFPHPHNGWMTEERAKRLRLPSDKLKHLLGFDDEEVMNDIQENSIRILDVCNNPSEGGENWGENRRGLVYGMVQSGKTANMLSLMALSMRAGYRLFVILSGDKDSLRKQTQDRVNKAFNLENGRNTSKKIRDEEKETFPCNIDSPTYNADFKSIYDTNYSANLLYNARCIHHPPGDWCTIIVMKKETHHLNALIDQINEFRSQMEKDCPAMDFDDLFPAMIIDDEADYASLNTKAKDRSRINKDLISLRNALGKNCYASYTATPQGCLLAADEKVGYPRHFWWMIEPFYEIDSNGKRRNKSYLGVWEVFRSGFSSYLLHSMSDTEWPHHEKDPTEGWKSEGIRVPEGKGGKPASTVRPAKELLDIEEKFLDDIIEGKRDPLPTIRKALMDHIITCGVRWWRNWNGTKRLEKPSLEEIERSSDYKHHSSMVHLSLKQTCHKKIRTMIQEMWKDIKTDFESFDPESSPDDHPFRDRWTRQIERTRYLITNHPELPFDHIRYFMSKCIEITEKPIYNPKTMTTFSGNPWVYLLNSNIKDKDAFGMKLDYRKDAPSKTRAKKAAVAVGGNILSRGLTLEGLSISVYGRSAANEKHDTDLQRCRWLGHKMEYIDLIAIHLHDSSREVFRDIAEKDDLLRRQLKLALHEYYTPMEALIMLHNSPLVAPTSKSGRAKKSKSMGFSGTRVHLDSPSFKLENIIENSKTLEKLREKTVTDKTHSTNIARDFGTENTIRLLRKLKCPKGASQASFGVLADYLDEWNKGNLKGEFSAVPRINIVIRSDRKVQRKFRTTDRPGSIQEAISKARMTFDTVPRGADSKPGTYRGDAFLDSPRPWHDENEPETTIRNENEDMLIVLYPLDPNYIREAYYDWSKKSKKHPFGKRVKVQGDIRLQSNHPNFVPGDLKVLTYVAWVPKGGPAYDVWSSDLLDPEVLKQRGLEVLEGGGE